MRKESIRRSGMLMVCLFCMLMVCLFCMLWFSGCKNQSTEAYVFDLSNSAGSVDSAQGSNSSEDGSKANTEQKPSGKLVVWTWDAGEKALAVNMEAFQTEYPDIEVEVQIMSTTDLYKNMLLGLSADGEGLPDIATIETSYLAQFVSIGGLMDLTEKTASYRDKMNSYKWKDAGKEGRIYAMPWDSGPVALYYRTDIFEKAGLSSEPEEVSKLLATWDDYLDIAKIIKEKTGCYMLAESKYSNEGRDYEKMLLETGSFYFDEMGNPQLNSPDAVRVMTCLTDLVNEGLTDNTTEWTQSWYDSIANGTIATILGAVWMGGYLDDWIAPNTSGLWRVIPLPVWDAGGSTASIDGGSNLVISDTSTEKEAAWAYVEFMLGRESSQLAMYREADIFPALETTYTDAYFDDEVEFYGNQKAREVFVGIVSDISSVSYTEHYSLANEALREAFAKIILKGESVEQALTEANERVKAEME